MEPYHVEFIPEDWGEYLIEVTGDNVSMHTAATFFYASYWGRMDGGMQNAGLISLQSDKEQYQLGDKAQVTFPLPEENTAIITWEKGDKVIDQFLYKGNVKNNQGMIEIPVTEAMKPNIYCSVSVLQPHAQSDNDRPVRMYGVIPLHINDPKTAQTIYLTVADTLRPNQPFSCEIQTRDYSKAQFTIAVVDEGLLSLTDHQSPDAWKYFYQKIRLAVETFDNYGYFIGLNKGDIFKRFAVG